MSSPLLLTSVVYRLRFLTLVALAALATVTHAQVYSANLADPFAMYEAVFADLDDGYLHTGLRGCA